MNIDQTTISSIQPSMEIKTSRNKSTFFIIFSFLLIFSILLNLYFITFSPVNFLQIFRPNLRELPININAPGLKDSGIWYYFQTSIVSITRNGGKTKMTTNPPIKLFPVLEIADSTRIFKQDTGGVYVLVDENELVSGQKVGITFYYKNFTQWVIPSITIL